MPELVLTRRARSDLENLPTSARAAAATLVERLRLDPRVIGQPLLGRLRPLWSARVGNHRVIYTIEGVPGHARVVVRAIKHRALAYGKRRRRLSPQIDYVLLKINSVSYSSCRLLLAVEPTKQSREVIAREFPLERGGDVSVFI